MGAGLFDDWTAIERFVVRGPRYEPHPRTVERYDEGYAVYRELYPRLQPLFPLLRRLERGDDTSP
jgi:xylulokinase